MTASESQRPSAWELEEPWPHQPCGLCYRRNFEPGPPAAQLVVFPDCPRCLGTGVEGPEPGAPRGDGVDP